MPTEWKTEEDTKKQVHVKKSTDSNKTIAKTNDSSLQTQLVQQKDYLLKNHLAIRKKEYIKAVVNEITWWKLL